MNTLFKLRTLCIAWLAILLGVMTTSCKKDNTDGNLQIHYPEVVNIGPSMSFSSSAPTYYGSAPTNFSITGITLDDKAIASASFAIDASTGVVSISNTNDIATGLYKLTISCQGADGGSYTFRDVFVVRMVAATPEQIEVSAPELIIPYAEPTSKTSVTVSTVGESVAVIEWGLVQPEGVEYFAISKTGVITLNAAFKGDKLPGVYPLPIRIKTSAGEMVYENMLTAKITSEPLLVTYPAPGRLEVNQAFTGLAPQFKGSPEGLTYAIREVTPACDKFTIDAATGVISTPADNGLAVDDQLTFSLTVANNYGSVDFDAAYTVTVIAYIAPIDPEKFGYESVEIIQAQEFTAPKKAGFVGDEAQFALGMLPTELAGKLSIDAVSGEVSAKKGHSIPVGTFEIPVKATNPKGEAETKLTLKVNENPYYFTKIVYGNNLGLTPVENYANQFRFGSLDDLKKWSLTPTTDAKSGTTLEWTIVLKHQMKTDEPVVTTTTINDKTGVITSDAYNPADGGNGGLVLVTATAGKGKDGETSVTIPVFFSFSGTNNGVSIFYKPFVFQVNPRKGATSVVPEITGVTDWSKFMLDYRRTFNYYNIAGPAQHVDGIPSATSFLGGLWKAFYTAIGTPNKLNYGSKDPVSYYVNETRLPSALLYVNKATNAVVVNPGKWVDDYGAANGAFFAQMTFVTDGSAVNTGTKYFPLWIWFDEKF